MTSKSLGIEPSQSCFLDLRLCCEALDFAIAEAGPTSCEVGVDQGSSLCVASAMLMSLEPSNTQLLTTHFTANPVRLSRQVSMHPGAHVHTHPYPICSPPCMHAWSYPEPIHSHPLPTSPCNNVMGGTRVSSSRKTNSADSKHQTASSKRQE